MLDILVLIIISLYAFKGWRRGLIFSVFSIAGYIVSLFVARKFSPNLTNFLIDNTGVDRWVESFLGSRIKDITQIDIPINMVTNIAVETVVNAISFFIIFSITSMIMFNIAKILNQMGRLPVIGQLNKFGGLAFGALKGFILIFVVLAVLSFMVNTGNNKLSKSIENTIIVDIMYKNNPILSFISDIFEPKKIKQEKYI